MTNQPQLPEDRDTELLLRDALGTSPPLRDAFGGELSAQLDAEFASAMVVEEPSSVDTLPGAGAVLGPAAIPSVNGHARANRQTIPGEDPVAVASPQPTVAPRRWPWMLVTAASLLLAVAAWSSRPNYSWASMIDAIDNQPWVHAEAVRDGVAQIRQWIASQKGVSATSGQGRIEYVRALSGSTTLFSYSDAEPGIVRRAQTTQQPTRDWNRLLPGLLSGRASSAPKGQPQPQAATLLDESWRRVESSNGQRYIELTVRLLIDGETQEWILLLDPETHLPVSAHRTDGGDSVRFSFPQDGPDSIHALGVAEDAQEVTYRPSQDVPLESWIAANHPLERALLPLESEPQPRTESPIPPEPEPLGDPLWPAELTHRIDELLANHWASLGVDPAPAASDAEFLRRIYLDLTGRIPTVSEARVFLEDSQEENRRAKLVDELLASRDHATHFATVWRKWLIPATVDLSPYGGPERLDQWLADRFQDNLRYDELASELLLAEGRISESGPLLFYAALKLNPEEIAQQTSRTFLGMQLDCAQCHDHPFDERISQEDFWGFAAMFAQISRPRGKIETVSPVMRVHDNRRGEVRLPDLDYVVPPRLPLSDIPVSDAATAPFRREQFTTWLVDPHNERFRQAVVNRVWAHLFGRGLVDPVDDIRAENPPIVPAVLEEVSLDFARSGFDLRRLVRQIVLSDAYQRTSASATNDEATAVFARMNLKSFTAEQLHDCIAVATRSAATAGRASDAGLVRFGDTSRQQFIELFDAPGADPVDFHAGIPQALTMMHGGVIHSATDLRISGLLKSLSAPFFTDEQRIETLFLATLSRMPTEAEMGPMSAHVAAASGTTQRQQRLGDVLWALLNTAEFTLNH